MSAIMHATWQHSNGMDLERIILQGQQARHHRQACKLVVQQSSKQKLTKRVANCWDPTRGAAATPADINSNILHIIHMVVIHQSSALCIMPCWLNESGLSAPHIAHHSYGCDPRVFSIVHHPVMAK